MTRLTIRAALCVAVLGSLLVVAPRGEAAACDPRKAAEIEQFAGSWIREYQLEWVRTNEGAPGIDNEPGESSPDPLETWEQQKKYTGEATFTGALDLAGVSCVAVRYAATVTDEAGASIATFRSSGDGTTGDSEENPFVLGGELQSTVTCVRVTFESVLGTVQDSAPEDRPYHTFCDDGGGGFPYLK